MNDREVPFYANDKCDKCGTPGAYDFAGDSLCPECAAKVREPSKPDPDDDGN